MILFPFLPNLNSTLSPTKYCEHLFRCLKYFTVLLETSLFHFFTASLALIVFRSLWLLISLEGFKHGWTTGSLSFSIDFPHWSSLLDFLPKYISKADLQQSSSLFSLRHFAYFCKFFNQLTPACFCVSRSSFIFFLKDLYDRSSFPCDWGWCGRLYRTYTSAWVFSCKFATYFQNTFSWKHLWTATSKCFDWSGTSQWKREKRLRRNKIYR